MEPRGAGAGLAIAIGLAGMLLSGCSHYLRAEVHVTRQVRAADLPDPEVISAAALEARRGQIRRISLFYLEDQGGLEQAAGFVDRADIRELERSFVRGGFTVLEVRQLSQERIEALQLDAAAEVSQYAPDADAIVLVYDIGARDVTRAEVRAEPAFAYGGSLDQLAALGPEQIEEEVGREGAMSGVVSDVRDFVEQARLLDVEPTRAAFIDSKIIDARTREVLMFYRAYTLVDVESLPLGAQRETHPIGAYVYDREARRFVRLEEDEPEPEVSSGYGDLAQTRQISGQRVSLKSETLSLVEQACDDLVRAFRTPAAARY